MDHTLLAQLAASMTRLTQVLERVERRRCVRVLLRLVRRGETEMAVERVIDQTREATR